MRCLVIAAFVTLGCCSCGERGPSDRGAFSYCIARSSCTLGIAEPPSPDDLITCPRVLMLVLPVLDPALLTFLVDGVELSRYSCGFEDKSRFIGCTGPVDNSCPGGVECVKTWVYEPPSEPPDSHAEGGMIVFAEHFDPCYLAEEYPIEISIEIVYATDCS